MPMRKGRSREVISSNIRELVHAGYPQRQAIAIAMKESRMTRKNASQRKGTPASRNPKRPRKKEWEKDVSVHRHPLDRQGYDKLGRYFGVGEKLWEIDGHGTTTYARGKNRREALEFFIKHSSNKESPLWQAVWAELGRKRNGAKKASKKRRNDGSSRVASLRATIAELSADMKKRGARSLPSAPKTNDPHELEDHLVRLVKLNGRYLQRRNGVSTTKRPSISRLMNPSSRCWKD